MVGGRRLFCGGNISKKKNGKQSEFALLARQEQFHKIYHIHKIYGGSAGPICL